MPSDDPVLALTHDHRHLTERALSIRSQLANALAANGGGAGVDPNLALELEELRDDLLTHFALEEEGLFPFVRSKLPDLRARAEALATGHDAICGAVSRVLYLVQRGGDAGVDPASLRAAFERFDAAYAAHGQEEAAFLGELARRLGGPELRELKELLAAL